MPITWGHGILSPGSFQSANETTGRKESGRAGWSGTSSRLLGHFQAGRASSGKGVQPSFQQARRMGPRGVGSLPRVTDFCGRAGAGTPRASHQTTWLPATCSHGSSELAAQLPHQVKLNAPAHTLHGLRLSGQPLISVGSKFLSQGTWARKTKWARGSLHRCLPGSLEQLGQLKKEKFFLDLGPEPGHSSPSCPQTTTHLNHPLLLFPSSILARPTLVAPGSREGCARGLQPALPLSVAFPSSKLWYLPS